MLKDEPAGEKPSLAEERALAVTQGGKTKNKTKKKATRREIL